MNKEELIKDVKETQKATTLLNMIDDIFDDGDQLETWFTSESEYLDGQTPEHMVENGELDRLIEHLATLASGSYR